VDPIGADLVRTLKELKLGQMTQTLPERLVLARQQKMTHAAFLQLILADEITRRDSRSATLRARAAGLDPSRRLDTFDELDDLTYDRDLLADLATLRFTEAGHGALVLGPVGVGKTHLASALGHIAIRRRMTVHAARADKLFTRLRASRLDNTLEAELRKLARVDLLILDDFALKPLDATQTNDFYELVVDRHRRASTVVTSNREPSEWLTLMSDALLAQSAVDRLTSGAHPRHRGPVLPPTTPVGEPALTPREANSDAHSHDQVVPSSWQRGGPITLASDSVGSSLPSMPPSGLSRVRRPLSHRPLVRLN
jgi:DNA replication protein DnaC